MKPEQALIHFGINASEKVAPLTVGLIHATYYVQAAGQEYVLQLLHPKLADPSLTADYLAITDHLARKGLVSQRVIRTVSSTLNLQDDDSSDRRWRLLTFVPGKILETVRTPAQARAAGAAVGSWHAALKDFKYQFKSALAFHPYDTPKFLRDFKRVLRDYAKSELLRPVRADAEYILKKMPRIMLPAGLPKRVVHGDLKITNFVFDERGREVRAIIDLDTGARFSPLLELGDAMRSWCGRREDDPKNKFNLAVYRAAVAGYLATGPELSAREQKLLPQAVLQIILGQALRFLKDYFEDNYFGWDTKKYSSRRAANLARYRGQLALFKDAEKKLG